MNKHPNHNLSRLLPLTTLALVHAERVPDLTQQTPYCRLGAILGRRRVPVHLLLFDRRGRRGTGGPAATRNRHLSEGLPNHLGRKEEMVVVDDDKIAWAVDLGDFLGKEGVGLGVGDP